MDQSSVCTALVSPHTVARYVVYNTAVGLPTLAFVVFLVSIAAWNKQRRSSAWQASHMAFALTREAIKRHASGMCAWAYLCHVRMIFTHHVRMVLAGVECAAGGGEAPAVALPDHVDLLHLSVGCGVPKFAAGAGAVLMKI